MSLILLIWSILLLVFVGSPSLYYLYMRQIASRPWKLKMDRDYFPSLTILVPAYNEEKSIRFKLENLLKVEYPKDRMEIILINDLSTDKTLQEISNFQNANPCMHIKVLNNTERMGKSASLNSALQQAIGDIIIVSDADCFWPPDILSKALPYLSDPSVGAISGLEILLNPDQSWVTGTEIAYNDLVHTVRVGESKTHSTIFFQGGFGAFKRALITEFDDNADDSGTALKIAQKNARALLVPEVIYFTMFPTTWLEKIAIKRRRARQLTRIWTMCLKLLLKGKLVLPKRICLPETFLYMFNPIIFSLLAGATLFLFASNPLLTVLLVILLPIVLFKKSRTLFIEVIQDNLIILSVLFAYTSTKRFSAWKTVEGSRFNLTRDILEKRGLV